MGGRFAWVLGLLGFAILAVCVATLAMLMGFPDRVRDSIDEGVQIASRSWQVQTKTDEWQWEPNEGQCVAHTVTTERMTGESLEDFCARHHAAVTADLKAYPPKTQ